jgi:hypothetical protein
MNARRFEGELSALLAVVAADASTESDDFLQDLKERLANGAPVISGDPDGVYTYDDPVLALAAMYAKLWEDGQLASAGDGHELRNSRLDRWLRVAFHAVTSHLARAEGVLMSRVPSAPVTINADTLRLAVIGDAGYAGQAQTNVLRMIRARHAASRFDRLVHLGDTYFGGSIQEITRNLLVPLRSVPVAAYSLCGNHDLYYGPEGYEAALTLLDQPGRYFAIESPHYIVACLDTALASARVMRNDGALDPAQLAWLEALLLANEAAPKKRSVVLMSHHFMVSDWEQAAETLRRQLQQLVRGRVLAWYWGHEHRAATYEAEQHGFAGACVGHGAFLAQNSSAARTTSSWHAEGRCNCYRNDGPAFHPHGFLELELRPDRIVETHHLEEGRQHSRELKRSR